MRRRLRTREDGKYLPKDAKAWRRLIRHVRYIVRAPLADTSQLFRAAERCAKAVPPPGFAMRGSAFLTLCLKARAFGKFVQAARFSEAPELGALASTCEAALNAAAEAARPTREPRRDIFG